MSGNYLDPIIVQKALLHDPRFKNYKVEILYTSEYMTFRLYDVLSTKYQINYLARFQLHQMPGCCGILVSTNTFVEPDHRNRGHALVMQQMKEVIARVCGYSILFCTVNTSDLESDPQQHILKKTEWLEMARFKNLRTNNKVSSYIKEIVPKPRCSKCGFFSGEEVGIGIPWCPTCRWPI